MGIGGYLIVRAWTDKFDEELDDEGRSGTSGTAYLWLGKLGYTAKGIAFGIVGALFLYAALTHEPKKSGGLDQALLEVLRQALRPVPAGADRPRARLLRAVLLRPGAPPVRLNADP